MGKIIFPVRMSCYILEQDWRYLNIGCCRTIDRKRLSGFSQLPMHFEYGHACRIYVLIILDKENIKEKEEEVKTILEKNRAHSKYANELLHPTGVTVPPFFLFQFQKRSR